MPTERVFCCRCMKVVIADVQRLVDQWVWHCLECDSECEREFIDDEPCYVESEPQP